MTTPQPDLDVTEDSDEPAADDADLTTDEDAQRDDLTVDPGSS